MKNQFWQTVGLATVAGMRSMTAPALLSRSLVKHNSPYLGNSPLRFLQSPATAKVLATMAAGELVMDKLPSSPDRTVPGVLAGRLAAGALVGAGVYKSRNGSAVSGALLGGLVAVAATYATLSLRKALIKSTGQPVVAGLIEDVATLASGKAILQGRKGTKLTKKDKQANKKARKLAKAKQVH